MGLCENCKKEFIKILQEHKPWPWEHCHHDEKKTIQCPYTKCAHGMSVAGTGSCYVGGNPDDPLCEKFISDEEWDKQHEAKSL